MQRIQRHKHRRASVGEDNLRKLVPSGLMDDLWLPGHQAGLDADNHCVGQIWVILQSAERQVFQNSFGRPLLRSVGQGASII